MSFKNRWTISCSYEFQAHQQHSQRRWCFSHTALLWFEVLPDMSPVLSGALLCNTIRRLGNRQRAILRQRVRGSLRAVRAVQNTWVLQMETRIVADDLALGGCITKEKTAVKLMAITKGSWKDIIMDRMKPKNMIRKYSKESLEKLNNYGRKKVWVTSILRI